MILMEKIPKIIWLPFGIVLFLTIISFGFQQYQINQTKQYCQSIKLDAELIQFRIESQGAGYQAKFTQPDEIQIRNPYVFWHTGFCMVKFTPLRQVSFKAYQKI